MFWIIKNKNQYIRNPRYDQIQNQKGKMNKNNLSIHVGKESNKMIDRRIREGIIGRCGSPGRGKSSAGRGRRRRRPTDSFGYWRRRRRFLKYVRSLSAHYGRHVSQPQRNVLSLLCLRCLHHHFCHAESTNFISTRRIN